MNYTQRIEALLDDMSVFEDWTEKYEFIISLGRKLPAMPDKYRKPANLIKGCQSRVWVGTEVHDGKMIIMADSDSLITKGLIALFVRLFSGLTPAEIQAADMKRLDECGRNAFDIQAGYAGSPKDKAFAYVQARNRYEEQEEYYARNRCIACVCYRRSYSYLRT